MKGKSMKSSNIVLNAAGAVFGAVKPTFTGPLSDNKSVLRHEVDLLTWAFTLGGTITVCRPAIAQGASFSRNQRPPLRH